MWASDGTNLPDVQHLASARFLCPWFVRMRPSLAQPQSGASDPGKDGSGPIHVGPAPVCQCCNQPTRCSSFSKCKVSVPLVSPDEAQSWPQPNLAPPQTLARMGLVP